MAGIERFFITCCVALIRVYQLLISPLLGMRCRFYPSCSQYAKEAILQYGIWRGLRLAVWRLVRCQPGCAGGVDHVPPRNHHSST
jgi:uncharacterized protein